MEYVHNLIWLCPMLFVAGFIDSIAGGGGLIAMPAYMMCGMPMYYVYGCNKFQCAFGSTAAAYKYFKSGCLDLKITAVSAVSSFLCSFLGTPDHFLPHRRPDPVHAHGAAAPDRPFW